MHQTDVCSSSGGSIDTTTSSTTTTDPPPRRSNSHHRSKKSIVTTLSSAIFAASAPMSAAPITRSNSSSALALSESEIRELEEPWRYTPPPPELTDPLLFKPVDGGVRPTIVWRYCTMRGWVTKHIPPSYSFTKSKKERYVILADRMLYAFKTDTPSAHFKEVFELTKETNVFVTDQFTGVLYCIEITKRSEELRSWYIQCETAELMKTWLDRLKRTVQWLREERPGIVTLKGLGEIQTENDALENKRNGSTDDLSPPLSPTAHAAHHHHYHHRPPSSPHLTSSTLSSSDGSVDTRRHDSVASDQSDTTIQTKMLAQQQQQQQANILGSYYSDYYDWQSSVASSTSVHVSPSSSSLSSMSTYHSSHQAQHHQPLYAPYDQAPLPARRNTSPAVQYHHHQQNHHVLPPRNLPPQLPPPRSALPPPPPQYQKYYYS